MGKIVIPPLCYSSTVNHSHVIASPKHKLTHELSHAGEKRA